MTPPIHGRFTWTEDELAEAQRVLRRDRRPWPKRRESLVLKGTGFLMLIGIVLGYRQPRTVLNWIVSLAIVPALIGAWQLLMWWAVRQGRRTQFRKMPPGSRETEWWVTDHDITFRNSVSESRSSLSIVAEVDESERGFLARSPTDTIWWFPKSSFDDPSDIDRFRLIAKARKPLDETIASKETLDEL